MKPKISILLINLFVTNIKLSSRVECKGKLLLLSLEKEDIPSFCYKITTY